MPITTGFQKTHPFNVKLRYSLGTATDLTNTDTPWTQLGDMRNVNPGGAEWNESDTTHLASTDAFKESMAGWGKQEEVSFKLFFHEDNMEQLLEATATNAPGYKRQTASWAIEGPTPANPTTKGWVYYHTAWIKKISVPDVSADSDDPLYMDVTLMPTGRSNFSTATT